MQLNFNSSVLSSKKFWFICHRYCVMFVVNPKVTKNWESQNAWRKATQSRVTTSSGTQGQLVEAKRSKPGRNHSGESFHEKLKEPLENESPQTIIKRLCECRLLIEQKKKSFVLLCPIAGFYCHATKK